MKLLRLSSQIHRKPLGEGCHEVTPVTNQVVQGRQHPLLRLPVWKKVALRHLQLTRRDFVLPLYALYDLSFRGLESGKGIISEPRATELLSSARA